MSKVKGIIERPDDAREGVVLLHGIGRTWRSMARLARACRRAGYATLNVDYPSRRGPLDRHLPALHETVAPFAARFDRLHVIGFSMGGLLAIGYLQRHRPENLGRVLLIGTPLGGSEVADMLLRTPGISRLFRRYMGPSLDELATLHRSTCIMPAVDYPLGVIAGATGLFGPWGRLFNRDNDGLVAVDATRCDGLTAHIVLPYSHNGLLWRRAVADRAVAYLQHGAFT